MVVILIYAQWLLNSEKVVLNKDYRFDKVFVIFNKLDINRHEVNEDNPRTFNKINTKMKW